MSIVQCPFTLKVSLVEDMAQLSHRNWVLSDGEHVFPCLVVASHPKAGFASSPGLPPHGRLQDQWKNVAWWVREQGEDRQWVSNGMHLLSPLQVDEWAHSKLFLKPEWSTCKTCSREPLSNFYKVWIMAAIVFHIYSPLPQPAWSQSS